MKVFLYRKNNAVRFIAIVLAFIMLAVPFFAHAGFKGDSKAAEEGEEGETGDQKTLNVTAELTEIGTLSIYYDVNRLTIKSDGNIVNAKEKVYIYDSQFVNIFVNGLTLSNVSGNILESDVEVTDSGGNRINKRLSASYDGVYYKSEMYDSPYTKWSDDSPVQLIADESGKKYIEFCIKVDVKENVNGNEQPYESFYVPLAKVSFRDEKINQDNGKVPIPCFKSNNLDISVGTYYNTADFENTGYVMSNLVEGYLDKDNNFITNQSSVTQTGVYTPCARYYVDKDNTALGVIKDFKGTPVYIDADAPIFDLYIVKKNSDGTEVKNTPVQKNITKNSTIEGKAYINTDDSNLFVRVAPNDDVGSVVSKVSNVTISDKSCAFLQDSDGKEVYELPVRDVDTNNFKIKVTDNAGNENAITVPVGNVTNDQTAPSIDAADVKAYLTDGSPDEELLDSDTWYKQDTKNIKLTAKITDDVYVDSVKLYIKKPEDENYIQYSNESPNDIQLTYEGSDNKTANATVILPYSEYNSSGEYSFYFVADDKAGNECSTIDYEKTFNLDNTAPEAEIISYELRIKNADGSWGEWQTWNPADGKYLVNKDGIVAENVQYRIRIKAEDKHSGYDHDSSGKVDTSNDSVVIGSLSYISGSDTEYNKPKELAYEIKADDVSNTESIITIRIQDNVGNYKDVYTGDIATTTTDINFDSTTLKIYETNNTSNEIKLTDFADGKLDININKSYTIKIDAYSGYAITSAQLSAVASDGTTDLTIAGDVSNLKFDNVTGRYTATITYVVPGVDILNIKNEALDNIKLSVTDNRQTLSPPGTGTDTAEKTIGNILYDISRPMLDKHKILNGSQEVEIEDKWYQQAELAYSIVSMSQDTSIDSGLSWISYDITGSKENKKVKVDNLQGNKYTATIDIPESADIYGTKITFDAEDRAANRIFTDNGANIAVIKVDKHDPSITSLTVNDKKNNEHTASYGVLPVVKAGARDNLTLDKLVIEVKYPDGKVRGYTKTVNGEGKDLTGTTSYTIEQVNGKTLDGAYKASAYAVDKSGRKSSVSVNSFVIDTTKPVVTSKIIDGTASPKTATPYYYKDNVGIELTYTDANTSADKVAVTDNGNAVDNIKWEPVSGTDGKYRTVIYASDEGRHSITINAKDTSGNVAVESEQEFVIDKTKPQVTAYVNGTTVYNDSMGNMMLTGNTSVAMNISDATADTDDSYVQVQRSTPSEGAGNPAYVKNGNAGMSFGEEGDYVVNFYTIDKACNSSDVKTVRFRIDKTSPELSINGAAGGTSASASTVTFTMKETFWSDADATVTIYRKASDGAAEQLYKTLNFNPSAYQTAMSETLTETGVYRFEFEAGDNVGHHSELSQTLIIDRDAPVVTLTGVKDYDMTDDAVEFKVEITDDFYNSKKVGITGTRTDRDGKTSKLDFGTFLQSTNPTVISKTFDEEGIYFITVETADAAGNSHKNTVNFVIDNTAPIIGDLSKYDGKTFTSFSWDEDLDELVSDLTVCDVQMFLNGSEYDGVSDIEDGSYVLLIAATDEMGHKTEKEARFELDTKAPVFIVTGVEDEEVKNEDYIINVSLQLEEDTLESVVLNGTNISVKNNTATVNVTEKGEYTLELKARDAAGNEATETITFKYGEEKSLWWLWIVIACCVLLAGTIIIIIVKNKKKQ